MPFLEVSKVSLREEFVRLASADGANMRELCRRFGISAPTGYKWLERHRSGAALEDCSRRPRSSPGRTPSWLEAKVLAVRSAHPVWGGRKIARVLCTHHDLTLSPSTVTAILHRHGLIDRTASERSRPWLRFERALPNELWQMDFKGHFALERGRCHALTVLDDHSRYSICLAACSDEKTATVQQRLRNAFRRYGRPQAIITDNGSPWSSREPHVFSPLALWLMDHDIVVLNSAIRHPQTLGKEERFHRTLKAEVIARQTLADLTQAQSAFDRWRHIYNHQRPHEALQLDVPASRYQPSPRNFKEKVIPFEYPPDALLRRVQQLGHFFFKGRELKMPKAFAGKTIALQPTAIDGTYDVYYRANRVAQVDLRNPARRVKTVNHVPEHP
jgi:transposase InsO family protein